MRYYPHFAALVSDALTRRDRSPAWLAKQLGVHESTVSRWLNQGARPREPETVVAVAERLGLHAQRQALLAAAGFGYQDVHDPQHGAQQVAVLPRPPNNLPAPLTPLVGRRAELAQIAAFLTDSDCRLMTLWGLGGIGKTRLALAAAAEALDGESFPDGVTFVPMTPIRRHDQIAPAIASALGLPIGGQRGGARRGPLDQLCNYLRNKRLLLVLDNLEQVADLAKVVPSLLEAAPGVKVLATSRERLNLPGEQVFPLGGLAYPARAEIAALADYDAPQLFLQAARRVWPEFVLDAATADNLAHLCRVVDGMPLALELAAAWTGALSLHEICREVDESLHILATTGQAIPPRHRSVEAAFDVSWQRLGAQAQAVFAQLTVFRGGFAREAAGHVADATLKMLTHLIGMSFVRFHPSQARYYIHELLRQFGAAHLATDPVAEEAARQRHAVYFCAYLAAHLAAIQGADQLAAIAELTEEAGNLREAWAWAAAHADLALLDQAMDALAHFYAWTGNHPEAVAALGAVIAGVDAAASARHAVTVAHALAWLAQFTRVGGDIEETAHLLDRCLSLLESVRDAEVDVRPVLALAALHRGHLELLRDADAAIAAYAQSYALYSDLEWRWDTALAQSWLGTAYRFNGTVDLAHTFLKQALASFEACGDRRHTALAWEDLSRAYMTDLADPAAAHQAIQRSLALFRQIDDRGGIASSLIFMAQTHCRLGQAEAAEPLLEEAFTIVRDIGDRPSECRGYVSAMTVYNYLGRACAMREAAERGLALARTLDDAHAEASFLCTLGNLALTQGDAEKAYALHQEALRVYASAGVVSFLLWTKLLAAYSAWKVGDLGRAQEYLLQVLKDIIARADVFHGVRALLLVAQVLAARGQPAHAVEIAAPARRAFTWEKSVIAGGVFLGPLVAVEDQLSPDVVSEAKARGAQRELFATVEEMLEEMQGAAWSWT